MRAALPVGVAAVFVLALAWGDQPVDAASRHARRSIGISAPGPFRLAPRTTARASPGAGASKTSGAPRQAMADRLRQSSARATPGAGDVSR